MGVDLSLLRSGVVQRGHVLKLSRSVSAEQARALALQLKQADGTVTAAEPDLRVAAHYTPTDPSYASQWHYHEGTAGIRAPAAWDTSLGAGVVVAVVDTGYRPHADLAGNLLAGYDFISTPSVGNDGDGRDADPLDPGDWVSANQCGYAHSARASTWHGTHVAGTIAAMTRNTEGVAGVAYGAKVLPVRVLGTCGGYTSDIIAGITWASGGTVSGVPDNTHPAQVINMSLGGSGSCSSLLQTAITQAVARGSTVVVSAGNSATDVANAFPANCSGVVAVAATGRTGARAYYSNFGSGVTLAAPGGDMSTGIANGVLSTLNDGSTSPGNDIYQYYQGTSMAAPHVSGVAALMLAAHRNLTPAEVKNLLTSSARAFPATCSQCGAGLLDAEAAVTAARSARMALATLTDETDDDHSSLATAQTLPAVFPQTVTGQVSRSGASDFYAIEVPAGATLQVTLNLQNEANQQLYLYRKANGALVQKSQRAKGFDEYLSRTNTNATPVTWVLEVRWVSNNPQGAYTLDLDTH
ncbi:S8 family serine peptidase [Ideonella sp. TBM-1]|uniref:S8 family serine peptidase n=2 Tax=Ideonella livida TaxID=2707176 RepID=A0A7C9TIQ4_9BURK|nr:S8 family serine peptidase [Ideonella livida]